MSILFTSEHGWIISHLDYLNKIYEQVEEKHEYKTLKFNPTFFEINSQYLRQNQVENFKQNNIKENAKKRKRKNITTLPNDILEMVLYLVFNLFNYVVKFSCLYLLLYFLFRINLSKKHL